jgi:hypothetical protein
MTKTTIKIVIKASYKVAAGHQPHFTGTGVHQDKRTRRNRTRGDRKRVAIREQL